MRGMLDAARTRDRRWGAVARSGRRGGLVRSRLRIGPEDVVDFFVYVVVLNLAAEYVPQVITETFTLSLLTALVLKLTLEVVVALKDRAKHRFRTAQSPAAKVVAGLLLWLLLAGSKFAVLALVAFVSAGQVRLGGFWSVTALILVLLLAREGVRRLLALPRDTRIEQDAPPAEG